MASIGLIRQDLLPATASDVPQILYWRRKLRQSVISQLVPVVPDSSTVVADAIELALPDGLVIRGIRSGNLTLAIELLRQL